ncbi:MAG: hypothetical protein C4K60_20275 [Ideonella sp. MAG2]|nr:MAG: hypothetical protein C4K60_20275 [Ideonella sp. MAG2]
MSWRRCAFDRSPSVLCLSFPIDTIDTSIGARTATAAAARTDSLGAVVDMHMRAIELDLVPIAARRQEVEVIDPIHPSPLGDNALLRLSAVHLTAQHADKNIGTVHRVRQAHKVVAESVA